MKYIVTATRLTPDGRQHLLEFPLTTQELFDKSNTLYQQLIHDKRYNVLLKPTVAPKPLPPLEIPSCH